MPRVNTVLGTIPAEELGIVAVHEHIGYGMPGLRAGHEVVEVARSSAYEETVPKLRKFREYGGGTFVDATGICNGRDVDYYKSLSAKTGVHIVACTGFVGGDTALPYFARASVDYLAEVFIHEITVGIGNTGAKAGVIKVGVSRGGRMTDLDKRIYRAAARAAVVTGVPILTHLAIDAENRRSTIFNEEGLPLDRVLFGHADDGVNAPVKPRDDLDPRAGRPHRLRHLRLRPRARRTRRSGAATAQGAPGALPPLRRTGACGQACSPRPTPTAARWAGRA